jgi:hypothetical protein
MKWAVGIAYVYLNANLSDSHIVVKYEVVCGRRKEREREQLSELANLILGFCNLNFPGDFKFILSKWEPLL